MLSEHHREIFVLIKRSLEASWHRWLLNRVLKNVSDLERRGEGIDPI